MTFALIIDNRKPELPKAWISDNMVIDAEFQMDDMGPRKKLMLIGHFKNAKRARRMALRLMRKRGFGISPWIPDEPHLWTAKAGPPVVPSGGAS
jgi:hypothetical protein